MRVLTDPITGAVKDIGRRRYRPTRRMRTLLGLLDGGGRGPTLRTVPDRSEIDHITPFTQHFARGRTAIDNLVLLARRDHVLKASGIDDIEFRPNGRDLAWTSFAGIRVITTVDDPLEPTPVPLPADAAPSC